MVARKTVVAWGVSLITIVAADVARVSAMDVSSDSACMVKLSSAAATVSERRQDSAIARSGAIPGLGTVHAAIGWDNRKTFTLVGDRFVVVRTFDPLTREVKITVSGEGDAELTIRAGGGGGLHVSKAGHVIDPGNAGALRGALEGRAIAAFRERIGNYERRLMAGSPGRRDDPHSDGFLLAGAFVSSLAGDPTAVGRARDLIMRRIHGKLQAIRFDFRDCVTEYEKYLLDIDKQRTQCLDAANDRDSWYARAADRLGCEAEFMVQALAGEGQFASCTTLGTLL